MVVTLLVIAILACICTWAWFVSQKNHVVNSFQEALDARSLVYDAVDERFHYAGMLLEKIDDPSLTKEASRAVASYSHDTLVASYDALDALLLPLQKAVFDRFDYATIAPYFSKLSQIEDQVEECVGEYNGKARICEYYRERNKGVAEKNGVQELTEMDLSSALRNRP